MDKLNHSVLQSSGLDKISITDMTVCFYCNTSLEKIKSGKCSECGFPQLGTEVEQKKFLNDKRALKVKLNDYRDKATRVRNMLLVVATIFLVNFLLIFKATSDYGQLSQGVIITALFGGLAFWSLKNPGQAIRFGIYLFAAIQIGFFLHNPQTLFAGYLFKLLCIVALVVGWFAGNHADKLGKELLLKKIDVS